MPKMEFAAVATDKVGSVRIVATRPVAHQATAADQNFTKEGVEVKPGSRSDSWSTLGTHCICGSCCRVNNPISPDWMAARSAWACYLTNTRKPRRE